MFWRMSLHGKSSSLKSFSFFLQLADKYVSEAEFEVWAVQKLQWIFSHTHQLLLWAVVTQLRDKSWYSSCDALGQNSVSTWKKRRKEKHAEVMQWTLSRKKPWRIHWTRLFQQLLSSLNVSLWSSSVGCFISQNPTTIALRKESNTFERKRNQNWRNGNSI